MKTRRAEAPLERRLHPESMHCAVCGQRLRMTYTTWRQVATLEGMVRLKVSVARRASGLRTVPCGDSSAGGRSLGVAAL